MNWNLDALTPRRPVLTPHTMNIEHYALKWVKKLARERHAPVTQTMRELLQQAVAHWRREGCTLGFPWGTESKVGTTGDNITALLDAGTLAGLREMMDVSGKTMSRVVSEILLDAMMTETEQMQADLDKHRDQRLSA